MTIEQDARHSDQTKLPHYINIIHLHNFEGRIADTKPVKHQLVLRLQFPAFDASHGTWTQEEEAQQ